SHHAKLSRVQQRSSDDHAPIFRIPVRSPSRSKVRMLDRDPLRSAIIWPPSVPNPVTERRYYSPLISSRRHAAPIMSGTVDLVVLSPMTSIPRASRGHQNQH